MKEYQNIIDPNIGGPATSHIDDLTLENPMYQQQHIDDRISTHWNIEARRRSTHHNIANSKRVNL